MTSELKQALTTELSLTRARLATAFRDLAAAANRESATDCRDALARLMRRQGEVTALERALRMLGVAL